MTKKQHGMYRGEKLKWEAACRSLGRPCDDAARRALHAKVGAPHSSADFNDDHLTAVIGEFKAISDMANLDAQLDAQRTSKERYLEEITRLAGQLGINRGLDGVSAYYRKFLGGTRVEKNGTETLRKLAGMMKTRAAKLTKPAAPKPTPAPAPEAPAADADFDPSAPFG